MKIIEFFKRRVEENLDFKFYLSTTITCKSLNLTFHKAINQKGDFVWINKEDFPKRDNESFYLTILNKLEGLDITTMIANSFNLFMNRQDFYSQYTFVKKVKNNENNI